MIVAQTFCCVVTSRRSTALKWAAEGIFRHNFGVDCCCVGKEGKATSARAAHIDMKIF
jgi:hypothetical protein